MTMIGVNAEVRNRIRLSVAAYAYEYKDDPIMSDDEFDALSNKINVDENPNSPSKLGVRGIPALFIFKNGEMISSKIGAAPKTDLKNWIDEST